MIAAVFKNCLLMLEINTPDFASPVFLPALMPLHLPVYHQGMLEVWAAANGDPVCWERHQD